MRSGRVTGGQTPFKQKNSGFVTAYAISLSSTHKRIHGEGSSGWPRVEPQGSPLSARNPSIAAQQSMSLHVHVAARSLTSHPVARRHDAPGRHKKRLICRHSAGLTGSASGALDQPRRHRIHDRFLFVRLMIVTQEMEDAVGEQEADFVDE